MVGPIDFIIVGFEGNKFDGSILQSLEGAIESGVISLIDLALVAKDSEGAVAKLNIADLGDEYLVELSQSAAKADGEIGDEDIEEVADLLENNTSAGLLIIEHLWAKPLKKSIIGAGGVLVADGRIHPDALNELENEGEG